MAGLRTCPPPPEIAGPTNDGRELQAPWSCYPQGKGKSINYGWKKIIRSSVLFDALCPAIIHTITNERQRTYIMKI